MTDTAPYPHLLSPLTLPRSGGLTLRNRTVKAATFEASSPDALVTDDLITYHRLPAAGDPLDQVRGQQLLGLAQAWLGGGGPAGTAGFFGSLGYRSPAVMAVAVGLCELGGGPPERVAAGGVAHDRRPRADAAGQLGGTHDLRHLSHLREFGVPRCASRRLYRRTLEVVKS